MGGDRWSGVVELPTKEWLVVVKDADGGSGVWVG